ncbi:MAG: glycoside hydrolase family 44 protein [Oscillospiraceae bacterium]|nr:glycoside hydrolase family 44 protein [Oscillospiraceae bacterium]
MNTRKTVLSVFCVLLSAAAFVQTGAADSAAVFGSSRTDTDDIEVLIDVSRNRKHISKYIYGINDVYGVSGVTVSAVKQAGAELSSYNWETNAANSAASGGYENSLDLVSSYSPDSRGEIALYTKRLVERAERYGIPSKYVTLQMMGHVANDTNGTVSSGDTPKRWASVVFSKNDGLLTEPDIYDDTVYMDEYVSYLADTYGSAADGGINGYFLDSEPELWRENYSVLGLEQLTAEGLISKSEALASSVKKIDPTALVYGPSVKGLESFVNLHNPDDWEQYKNNYSWFLDYYLDMMKQASDREGMRLLDVLDLHFISEARSVVLEPVIGTDTVFANEERMQAVRVLWDSNYTENSSTAILYKQHTPIIPTIQASIRMYYPDTKLSFSEYNFGGGNHISGGIAEADVLGIFSEQDVYMACLMPDSADFSYQKSGINIYTDYDGRGSSYGNISVYSDNGGDIMSSAYASVVEGNDGDLKAVLINKNSASEKIASVEIKSDFEYTSANIYSFDSESSEIRLTDTIDEIKSNSFDYIMQPLTVYLFEFSSDSVIDDDEDPNVAEENNDTQVTTSVPAPEHVEVDITADTSSGEQSSPTSEEVSSEVVTSVSVVGTDDEGDTITEIVTEIITEAPTDESSTDTAEVPDSEEKTEEKDVPAAVKVIGILLAAAVAAAIVYVLVTGNNMGKK